MELTTAKIGGVSVLDAAGRIDSVTAKSLEEKLLGLITEAPPALVVDFSNVDYISSAGLRVLLVVAKQSKAAHCKFALCSLKAKVREVFDISGFDTIMAIHPDRASALAAAAGQVAAGLTTGSRSG
jgi:anti-anti-sigma factor